MIASKFLEQLREETGPMHKQLEQTEVSQKIISPSLQLMDYQNYLKKIYSLHKGIEDHVFPILYTHIADIETRKKLQGIKKDLANTNTQFNSEAVDFIDHAFNPSHAFCMGIMYVSEGSTLGGLHIVKNVSSALSEQVKDATNFLTVYGAATGNKWKTFLYELDTFQERSSQSERHAIIAGATYGFKRTFEIFNN